LVEKPGKEYKALDVETIMGALAELGRSEVRAVFR
jgi:hypothetical protein